MESATVAWSLLALGLVAASGSSIASKRDSLRSYVALTLAALVLIAAASAVLATHP